MPNQVKLIDGYLVCTCGARAPDTSSAAKRFQTRHPGKCTERKEFTRQLATGTKSVDYDLLTGCSDDQLSRAVVDATRRELKNRQLFCPED